MATWPSLLIPTDPVMRFTLQNPTRSGGVSLNGLEQVVESGAERWQATGSFFIRGRAAALQFEAFLTEMMGRSGEVSVPTFSGRFINWPESNGVKLIPKYTRNSDLDGTVYEEAGGDFTSPVPSASFVTATLNATLAVGATSCAITVTQGGALQAGQLFAIGVRLYRIVTVSVVSNVYTLTFRPKVRTAASAGASVRITRPLCSMRFASDDEGKDFEGWNGRTTLNFVEAI